MAWISAGSYDLNRFLYRGYETDVVSVLYGAPGTGKTNFCLLAAVSQAKKSKVIYIDTEGGFSVERVKQLAGEQTENVLKNIFLLKPTNFDEQRDAFKKLLEYMRDSIGLIIVDGMTILYRLDLASAKEAEKAKKGRKEIDKINSELAHQMRILAEIARKRNVAVIVTNQVYRWGDTQHMVGGDILNYWGKCLIELVQADGKRIAYLRKHRSLPPKELDFQITNQGIRKRGWLS